MWAAVCVCFAVAMLDGPTFRLARGELASGRVAAFRAALAERDRLLRAAAIGDRNPRVPPIPAVPACYMYPEIVDDPRIPNWNLASCLYYDLESIRLRHDPRAQVSVADGVRR